MGTDAGANARRKAVVVVVVEALLYVHRNRRLIRDGSPGRPPRLALTQLLSSVKLCCYFFILFYFFKFYTPPPVLRPEQFLFGRPKPICFKTDGLEFG